MKELEQQQIILSGFRRKRGRYSLDMPPQANHISYRQEMVGKQYGWVKIINPEKRWSQKWNHCYVQVQCVNCKRILWIDLSSLQRRKSKGCQRCSQPRKIPQWLYKRLSAAKQRCENTSAKNYADYGGRGIKFLFRSVTEAGIWILSNLDNVKQEYEIDRIKNNGNYEPGNIRFVPRMVNQANRRKSVIPYWRQQEWPYTRGVITKMLVVGMTREEIIASAEKAVIERRKNWKLIEARLEFMILEMQDPDTVLPYRES